MANKVKFGLRSVHYAIATIADDGTATYGEEKSWPGAVSLSMDADGDTTTFWADDVKYYVSAGNSGYSGTLESAQVPADFETSVLGAVEAGNGIIVENADAVTTHFALLFEFEGDEKATRHVLYNCTASRPSIASQTQEGTHEPQTETVNLDAGTIYDAVLKKNIVKAKSGDKTTSEVYNSWFTTVPVPTAVSA